MFVTNNVGIDITFKCINFMYFVFLYSFSLLNSIGISIIPHGFIITKMKISRYYNFFKYKSIILKLKSLVSFFLSTEKLVKVKAKVR